jgi:hypothetical protein
MVERCGHPADRSTMGSAQQRPVVNWTVLAGAVSVALLLFWSWVFTRDRDD